MSASFGIFEDVDTGQQFVVHETRGLLGRSAECNIRLDSAHTGPSRKQMKFYLDGEDCPWVVNVGGEAAQCFLSGERCEFGEPLRIKVSYGNSLKQFKYLPIAPAGHTPMGEEDNSLTQVMADMKAVSKDSVEPTPAVISKTPRPAQSIVTELHVPQQQPEPVPLPQFALEPAPPPPAPPLPAQRLLHPGSTAGPAPAASALPTQRKLQGHSAVPAPPPPPPPPPKSLRMDRSIALKTATAACATELQATSIPLLQSMGAASRQDFLQQVVARSTEVKARLRKQPLTCVNIDKPAAVQQDSMVPTADELRLARAALRQTMVVTDVVVQPPNVRHGASIPADAQDDATRASSVWSASPPQHKHWSCQNVLMPIPASTGPSDSCTDPSDSLPAGSYLTGTHDSPAIKPPPPPTSTLSPPPPMPTSGAQFADAWIRSPAGEEFMAAVVAAEAKTEDLNRVIAEEPAKSISLVPEQPDFVPPGDKAARGASSFSFGISPVRGMPSSESPGGGTPKSVQQGPAAAALAHQSPTVASPPIASAGLSTQMPGLQTDDSEEVSRVLPNTSGGLELAAALAEVKRLQSVLHEVQLLLPEPGAPQAMADVHAFVAEVQRQMRSKPDDSHVASPAPRSGSAPSSMSLLRDLNGRGLGKGKGLCLFGGHSSSGPSSRSTPASSGMPSMTPATASAASVRHSQSTSVWEPQGPDFVCPVDGPEKMVGLSVWRHFEHGGWAKGSVFDWQPYSRVHTIVYNPGSHAEFSEFVNLEQRQPRAMISWRDPTTQVARFVNKAPSTHQASSHGEVSPVASVHASCTKSPAPRCSPLQFSFWPQTSAPAQEVQSSPVLSPMAGQPLLHLGQSTPGPAPSQIPGPPTGPPEWMGGLGGTPQQCGDTLLHMLSTPEAQALSPGIRFALDTAIRSAQCSLADPNADFTEPLSPPVWHAAPDHPAVGFRWLNTASHYVSSTPPALAPQAAAVPVIPAGEESGIAPVDVEMADAEPDAPRGIPLTPEGKQPVGVSPQSCGSNKDPVHCPPSLLQQNAESNVQQNMSHIASQQNSAQPPSSPAPMQQKNAGGSMTPILNHAALSQNAAQQPPSPAPPQQQHVDIPPTLSPVAPPQNAVQPPSSPAPPQQQHVDMPPILSPVAPPQNAVQQPSSPAPPHPQNVHEHPLFDPLPVQQGKDVAEAHPGPGLMQESGDVGLLHSPSLALASVNNANRPVSPLSVMGVLPASPYHATTEQSAPRASHPSKRGASFGARLGVDLYTSPESTADTEDWQVKRGAGMTPFLACTPESHAIFVPAQASPNEVSAGSRHEVAALQLHQEILPAPAQVSPFRVANMSARSPLACRTAERYGVEENDGVKVADKKGDVPDKQRTVSGEPMPAHVVDPAPAINSTQGDFDSATQPSFPQTSEAVPLALPLFSPAGPVISPIEGAGPLSIADENAIPPSEQPHASVPSLASSPVQGVQPAFSTPAQALQHSSGTMLLEAPATSTTSMAASSGAHQAPVPHQRAAMLSLSVLELPPCSQLASAGTPHPTPTAADLLPVASNTALSMAALQDAMLGAGIVASESPSDAAERLQTTPNSVEVQVMNLMPDAALESSTPAAVSASQSTPAVDDMPHAAAASHELPADITAHANSPPIASPDMQPSLMTAPSPMPVGEAPGTCATEPMSQIVPEGGEPRELPGQDIDDSTTNGSPGAVEVAGTQSPAHHDCVPCDEHGVEKADGPGTPDDDHARADLDGMDTCNPGSGSKAQPPPSAASSLEEEQPQEKSNENAGQTQEVAPQEGGLDVSVADTLIQSEEAAAASDRGLHPAPQDEHESPETKVPDEVCADELPPSGTSADAVMADSGAGAVDGILINNTICPIRKMTRVQARAAQASSAVPESPACHPSEAQMRGSDLINGGGESGLADEGSAPQASGVSALASTCDDKGDTSSRRTRSSRRTMAAKAIEGETAPVTARRTRARASVSVASEPAAPVSLDMVHVPRKPRSRRGQAQDGGSVLSGDSSSASEGPAPRRRTRATSAASLASASADTEDVAGCENQAADNLATSKLRQAEDTYPYNAKFAPLSPILEDVPEAKNGTKRKRPVKEHVTEPAGQATRRVTRRATRSQDTS